VTLDGATVCFDRARVAALLDTLELVAAGHIEERLPISPHHDVLDAIAHGVNVLVGELAWIAARAKEAQEQRAADLAAAVASAEARTGAMLRAIPDLMFVLRRDGTYVDFHARDSEMLFVQPSAFVGRTVRDVMPPELATTMMAALERASQIDDPVAVEYELPMDGVRFYEARIVRLDAEHLLSIVRDVTESKRTAALSRDLARRLISSQEIERQRIARDLHDDVSQRIWLLNFEIHQIAAARLDADALWSRLRRLSAHVTEIANEVHHISYELHPFRLQALGLVGALRSLCADMEDQRHLRVAFSHDKVPSTLGGTVATCLYRIVQEALHNVARHSEAHEAHVSLTYAERQVGVEIADSGVGFDATRVANDGLGLVSMGERVAALNGQLQIVSVPGGGTRVKASIPLESEATGAASVAG
jgi:signal transduction histidine kinase